MTFLTRRKIPSGRQPSPREERSKDLVSAKSGTCQSRYQGRVYLQILLVHPILTDIIDIIGDSYTPLSAWLQPI